MANMVRGQLATTLKGEANIGSPLVVHQSDRRDAVVLDNVLLWVSCGGEAVYSFCFELCTFTIRRFNLPV